jgi:hypothetical protein
MESSPATIRSGDGRGPAAAAAAAAAAVEASDTGVGGGHARGCHSSVNGGGGGSGGESSCNERATGRRRRSGVDAVTLLAELMTECCGRTLDAGLVRALGQLVALGLATGAAVWSASSGGLAVRLGPAAVEMSAALATAASETGRVVTEGLLDRWEAGLELLLGPAATDTPGTGLGPAAVETVVGRGGAFGE